jgi:lipopolysaccharide export system permease protein
MKLIDRYVSKQILVTGGFAVAVLSLVLVLGNVFKQLLDLLVNHDVPIEYILSFIGYIIPFSLTFTIPWGFLTAVLLVLGKMSAENELIALRSHGVSVPRACLSVFAVAVACCATCLWINTTVAPRAQEKMKSALFSIATSNPIAMFGSDQVIEEFPGKKIYVEKKHGNELDNLLMYDIGDDGEPMKVVYARKGKLETDLQNKQVLLRITDARFEQRDDNEPSDLTKIRQGITMEQAVLPISLKEIYEKNKKRRGLSQMTLNELLKSEDSLRNGAARTEISKRFSFSFASLAFALVGIPLAITAHRRETSIGMMFSLVVAFAYFLFIIVADTVRENPAAYPHLLMWLPNVLFMGLGVVLLRRMAKQ